MPTMAGARPKPARRPASSSPDHLSPSPAIPLAVAHKWRTKPKRKKARRGGRAFWVWLRGLDLNQRPSGYEPDELPGCSTPRHPSKALPFRAAAAAARFREDFCCAFGRPGGDLLSRVLRRSTIGAGAFHGRVRNGIGCSNPAIATRSTKR